MFRLTTKKRTSRLFGSRFAYLTIVPIVAFIYVLTVYPLLNAVFLSILRYRIGEKETPFVGLQNFVEVVTSNAFYEATVNTIYFVGVSVPLILLISLGIALLLNQKFRGNTILRICLLIPWAMPVIAVAVLWKWIYDPTYGVLNSVLYSLKLIPEYQAWKSTAATAMLSVINAHVWKFVPLGAILFLAALSNIPQSLYEAAEMDGAGILRKFRLVVIPMIKPMIGLLVYLQTIYALLWHFSLVYVLTGGGPGGATTTLAWLTYVKAFSALDFGEGSALALILSAIIAAMIPFYMSRIRIAEAGE